MFVLFMFTNRQRFLFVSIINEFVEMTAGVTNICCIAHVTFKSVQRATIEFYRITQVILAF